MQQESVRASSQTQEIKDEEVLLIKSSRKGLTVHHTAVSSRRHALFPTMG